MESLPNSLLTEINAVSRMDALTLRARYGHFFGENSTRSTASLRSEIIYKIQERHYLTRQQCSDQIDEWRAA